MTKPTLSPRQWGEIQVPPISRSRVKQLFHLGSIPGAQKVRYKAKSGRWAYRIEIPADAVRVDRGPGGRPKKEQTKQPRKGAEKREK